MTKGRDVLPAAEAQMERLPADMLREVWRRLDVVSKDFFRSMCKATVRLLVTSKSEMKLLLEQEDFLLERAVKYCRSVSITLPESGQRRSQGKRLKNLLQGKTAGGILVTLPDDRYARDTKNISLLASYSLFIAVEQEHHRAAIEKFNASARTKAWEWLSREHMESTFKAELTNVVIALVGDIVRHSNKSRVIAVFVLWCLLHCWDAPEELLREFLPEGVLESVTTDYAKGIMRNLYWTNFKISDSLVITVRLQEDDDRDRFLSR